MSNRAATQWFLVSLLMAAGAAIAVALVLKLAAVSWFQSVLQSSQIVLG